MKDARWQLAEEFAADDGRDFHAFPHAVRVQYLEAAQNYLTDGASREEIEGLAQKFRAAR